MITLFTGGPGTGKTAKLIAMLLELRKQEPDRLLFIHGIRNLRGIAHETIYCRSQLCDICRSQDDDIVAGIKSPVPPKFVEDWPEWKVSGSLIVVDEVQRIWRPSNGAQGPHPSISALETHRHYGLDFWLISQGPHLFHNFIRLLVGRHIHLVANWRGRAEYEWPECKQDVQQRRDAVERPYSLPKRVFNMYDSAEVHTKQPKRKPIAYYAFFALVTFFIVLTFVVVKRFQGRFDEQSTVTSQPVVETSQPSSTGPAQQQPVLPSSTDKGPFASHQWRLAATIVPTSTKLTKGFFIIKNQEEEVFINTSGLAGFGYSATVVDACHVEVSYHHQPAFPVYCRKERQALPAPGATPLMITKAP